uniref:Uncharacterized protein n=1 Tax=Prolemur simus TaxID=1328070 RepID=A0A8C9DQN3_PROSS
GGPRDPPRPAMGSASPTPGMSRRAPSLGTSSRQHGQKRRGWLRRSENFRRAQTSFLLGTCPFSRLAAEAFLVHLFEDAYLLFLHACSAEFLWRVFLDDSRDSLWSHN